MSISSSAWPSLSGMKTDFSGYGYTGAGNAMRGGGSHLTSPSHLSAYTPLSPLPVKSDLLTPSYQTYAQFGEF